MKYKYIFGPVPSRRFGISLGIDLVPFKICTFNCIYCECGRTTSLTLEKKEYIPIDDIIEEINDFLKDKPTIDFLTLTGSGEPTLNSGIGKLIGYLKNKFSDKKIALLTNGSNLNDDLLINSIKEVDVIKVTLNTTLDDALCKINNPEKSINIKDIIHGIIKLRNIFKNKIWIEVFIIPGMNDDKKDIEMLKKELLKINPDKIHLNSLDRPGAFENAIPSSFENLIRVKNLLEPLPVEIILKVNEKNKINIFNKNIEDSILSIIKRRPSTIDDIFLISGISKDNIIKYIYKLKENNLIEEKEMERGLFYLITRISI